MSLHKLFFVSCLLFIVGIFIVSLNLSFWFVILTTIITFAILFYNFKFQPIILISLFVIIGGFYYLIDDYKYFTNLSSIQNTGEFIGIIVNDPSRNENYQTFYLKINGNSKNPNVKILVKTKLSPLYFYGDEINISGKIEKPPDDYYGKYLAKEKIHGIVSFPEINLISGGNGWGILAELFKIKNNISSSFKKLLSPEDAAFLSGITLGITSDFSKESLQAFSLSGTRHLIAISGMNMTIITTLLLTLCAYLMPKKYAFILTSVVIVAFTAMIGFNLSAIRAAIMGAIAGSSKILVGRPSATYNAIALAAIVMILVNPKVLVYDMGFILSFLAVIAIICLTPLIFFILNIKPDGGLLNWKEMLAMTTAAQIATAPILISQFHNFSLISLLANLLVLPVIPILTWLGFLMGALSFISLTLEYFIALIISPIIKYVLFAINMSAKLSILYDPILNWPAIIIYYAIFIYIIYDFHTNKKYIKKSK
ncbi:MAG: ComEC/Rec2 family competence protein [bacterium]|nr:ComEC/Rec2 family competence protein [bacterium]